MKQLRYGAAWRERLKHRIRPVNAHPSQAPPPPQAHLALLSSGLSHCVMLSCTGPSATRLLRTRMWLGRIRYRVHTGFEGIVPKKENAKYLINKLVLCWLHVEMIILWLYWGKYTVKHILSDSKTFINVITRNLKITRASHLWFMLCFYYTVLL